LLLLDEQLPEAECLEIELHVETCRQCAEELECLTASEGEDLPIAPIPRGGSANGQATQRARLTAVAAPPLPVIPGYQVVGRLGVGASSRRRKISGSSGGWP